MNYNDFSERQAMTKSELITKAQDKTRHLPVTRLRNAKQAQESYTQSITLKMFMLAGYRLADAREWTKKVGKMEPDKVANLILSMSIP